MTHSQPIDQRASRSAALRAMRFSALALTLNLFFAAALPAQSPKEELKKSVKALEDLNKQFETNEPCPLTLADIEKVFGKGFTAEKPSKIGEIFSCRFSGKTFTVMITLMPSGGMKMEDYHKYASPSTVSWKPIPNDPDGAMIEVRDDQKDDLASTPVVGYTRKGKYVYLKVLGNYYNYDNRAQMPKLRDEMREKLAKLRRIP